MSIIDAPRIAVFVKPPSISWGWASVSEGVGVGQGVDYILVWGGKGARLRREKQV